MRSRSCTNEWSARSHVERNVSQDDLLEDDNNNSNNNNNKTLSRKAGKK